VTRSEPQQEQLLAQTAWLHALARSLLADRDLAADVAQETLVLAWRRGLADVLDVRAFLAQMLRRLAGRRVRREHDRRARELAAPPQPTAPAVADVVQKASMQREVTDAVLRLAEPYRTAILLRFLEERSYAEIAAATNAPLETVRTRIKRGLQQLRHDLDLRHGAARAWAVPILGVTGFREAVVGAGSAGAGAAAAGVLFMSWQTKMTVAAGAALLGLLMWQCWPAAPAVTEQGSAGAGAPLVVAAAPSAGKDRVLPQRVPAPVDAPTPATNAGVSWEARGRVVDEATNQGLDGARVAFGLGSVTRGEVTTAADGTFALPFQHSSPGFVELDVQHADFATTHVPLLEHIARSETAASTIAELGDVLLARGAQLGGRVLAADGRTPVTGARVLYYRAMFGVPMLVFSSMLQLTSTDGDGRYALQRRFGPGYRRQWLLALTDGGVGWRELEPSRRASDDRAFDLVLRPSATVRVRAVDSTNAPLAGVEVVAWPGFEPLSSTHDPANKQPSPPSLPAFLRAVTTADGHCVLQLPIGADGFSFGKPMRGGAYVLTASRSGHRRTAVAVDLRAGADQELLVRLVAGTTVAVAGSVRSSEGMLIAGAKVMAHSATAAPQEITSDAHGHFAFAALDAAEGEFTLHAHAAGFTAAERTESCGDRRGELQVDLVLQPAFTLTGIVVDQDDQPVAGAQISCPSRASSSALPTVASSWSTCHASTCRWPCCRQE